MKSKTACYELIVEHQIIKVIWVYIL